MDGRIPFGTVSDLSSPALRPMKGRWVYRCTHSPRASHTEIEQQPLPGSQKATEGTAETIVSSSVRVPSAAACEPGGTDFEACRSSFGLAILAHG